MKRFLVMLPFALMIQTAFAQTSKPGPPMTLDERLDSKARPADTVIVTCTIRNNSIAVISSADIGVKATEENDAQSCIFGRIDPGNTASVRVYLRGYVDIALYRVNILNGNPLFGTGTCNNCDAVNLTIGNQ